MSFSTTSTRPVSSQVSSPSVGSRVSAMPESPTSTSYNPDKKAKSWTGYILSLKEPLVSNSDKLSLIRKYLEKRDILGVVLESLEASYAENAIASEKEITTIIEYVRSSDYAKKFTDKGVAIFHYHYKAEEMRELYEAVDSNPHHPLLERVRKPITQLMHKFTNIKTNAALKLAWNTLLNPLD